MIALSYSRLQSVHCPFRFNALYIAKTYSEPESDAMRVGSAVHSCIEGYLRHCFGAGMDSDLEWLTQYEFPEDISEKCQNLIAGFRDRMGFQVPVASRWWIIEGKTAFNDYLLPLPGDGGWFSRNAAFRTVVDLAYVYGDTLYVVDWKTGRGDPDPFQTEIYAYLIPKLLPDALTRGTNAVKRVACVFGELAKGKMTTSGEFQIGDGAGQETHQRIVEWIERVNSWTEYPPVACDQCRWCRVPGCPIRNDVGTALLQNESPRAPVISIPKDIRSLPDAEKALRFIMFAEDIVSQVKDVLRSWVEINGPVSAAGKTAELRPNDPWKPGDIERILKALVAYGIQRDAVFGALGISESAIEKLLKKHQLQNKLPLLLSMGERKQYKPKFGIYNSKDDEY